MNPSVNAASIYLPLARYNACMNRKLFLECSKISDAERKTARGVPFDSLHGLWNHLLLTDRVWLGRFANRPFQITSLSQILCEDWDDLQSQQLQTDAEIAVFAAALTPEILASTLKYERMGEPRALPTLVAVSHLFNHQTHHRGQITAVMEQLGLDCGVTDLGAMPEFLPKE